MLKRLFALVMLFGLVFPMPNVQAAGEAQPCQPFDTTVPFTDYCYHQGVWYSPDTVNFDVLILPPASPYEARDWYLVEKSVDMWEEGIKRLAEPWLAKGLKINDYTLGHEYVPPAALADPEVIVALTTEVNPVLLLGFATQQPINFCHGLQPFQSWSEAPGFHSHPGSPVGSFQASCEGGGKQCYVVNTSFLNTPTYNNMQWMFDLISHEVGHCLTLGHVGDANTESTDDSVAYPHHDIMSYENDGLRDTRVHCVSTLNVRTLEKAFGHLLGQPGATTAIAPNPNAYAHMVPSDWKADACDDPNPALADVDWLAATDPLAEDTDKDVGGPDDPTVPRVTITSPADGAELEAGTHNVTGTVRYAAAADSDGDGIGDSTDNCPSTPNADQADSDGDGIGDACDGDNTDGPLGDADGDGVLNKDDLCPTVAPINDANGDGCEDPTGPVCGTDPAEGTRIYDITQFCYQDLGDTLRFSFRVADTTVFGNGCPESPATWGFYVGSNANPIEVYCLLGLGVSNWAGGQNFDTAATVSYANGIVTVDVPQSELPSVDASTPVYMESWNGPGAYGGRPMWLVGNVIGQDLYVDRAPDTGAIRGNVALATDPGNDGLIPGVYGEALAVNVFDDGTNLHIELDIGGALNAAVLDAPVSWYLEWTDPHIVSDQFYRVTYANNADNTVLTQAGLGYDAFGLHTRTKGATGGTESTCPVDADLSKSRLRTSSSTPPRNPGSTWTIEWIVPLSEFNHNNHPATCAAFTRTGRGLEADDVLKGIKGGTLVSGIAFTVSGAGDQITYGDYTVVGDTSGDADKDGVPDELDLCPGTPAGAPVDADGCEIPNGQRVELTVDGASAGWQKVTDDDAFDFPVDLAEGSHTLTATWYSASDAVLDTDTVTVAVGEVVETEERIRITDPAADAEIDTSQPLDVSGTYDPEAVVEAQGLTGIGLAGWDDPASGGTGDYVYIDSPAEGSLQTGSATLTGRAGTSPDDPDCTSCPPPCEPDCPDGFAKDSHVVIAMIDTGGNPYHSEFRSPDRLQHPSEYLSGFPASTPAARLCFVDEVGGSLVYNDDCPSIAAAHSADRPQFPAVTPYSQTGAGQGNLVWIPGTRLMAISFDHVDTTPVTVDQGGTSARSHGSWVSSTAVGETKGDCPECLLVIIEADTVDAIDAGYLWAANQPWIDVITTSLSVGITGIGWNPGIWPGEHDAAVRASQNGKIFLSAAGNGAGNLGAAPTSTFLLDSSSPAVIAVGSNTNNEFIDYWSDFPAHITGTGSSRSAGNPNTYTGTSAVGGTSFSAPSAAGVLANSLLQARKAVGDTTEGATAAGSAKTLLRNVDGVPVSSGPFENGILTRDELEEAFVKNANPRYTQLTTVPGPIQWAKNAYGMVNAGANGINAGGTSIQAAVTGSILGTNPVPVRALEQYWIDDVVRPIQEFEWGARPVVDGDGDAWPRDDAACMPDCAPAEMQRYVNRFLGLQSASMADLVAVLQELRAESEQETFVHPDGNVFYTEQSTLGNPDLRSFSSHRYTLNVAEASDVSFTLTWTDGLDGASDLDLYITGAKSSGSSGATVNLPETVTLKDVTGTLQIEVDPYLIMDPLDGATYTLTATVTPLEVPDADGDGVPDSTDECPTEPGPPENNGCPIVTDQVSFTVNGEDAGSADVTDGAWSHDIDFSAYAVNGDGQYVVVASYGSATDTRVFDGEVTPPQPCDSLASKIRVSLESHEHCVDYDPLQAGTWAAQLADVSDLTPGSYALTAEAYDATGAMVASHTITVVVSETDTDGDGVRDNVDNCPTVPNPGQEDTDGDGSGDACDAQDNRDSDGDGVQNWEDQCPGHNDFADMDGDGIADGCDSDRDGDGFTNEEEAKAGTDPNDPNSKPHGPTCDQWAGKPGGPKHCRKD